MSLPTLAGSSSSICFSPVTAFVTRSLRGPALPPPPKSSSSPDETTSARTIAPLELGASASASVAASSFRRLSLSACASLCSWSLAP